MKATNGWNRKPHNIFKELILIKLKDVLKIEKYLNAELLLTRVFGIVNETENASKVGYSSLPSPVRVARRICIRATD